VALFNESLEARFAGAIARLHGMKGPGSPAPQVSPEIAHAIQLEQTSFTWELEALIGRRNLFVAVTAPAIAAVSAGIRLIPPGNGILVVTGVQVNKPTAGFVQVLIDDFNAAPFGGTYAASVVFFRDTRWGNSQTARPGTQAATHLTGGLPVGPPAVKRVGVAANTFTQIPISPAIVLANPSPGAVFVQGSFRPAIFGVFSETLNETLDVMVDCYERGLSPAELQLPQ